jgi:hypothetical protein
MPHVKSRCLSRNDGGVKYARAVHHLREIAEAASEFLSFRDTTLGWPLEELWIAGELLKFPQELDVGSLVLRVNLPANKLPWLGEQRDASWVAERLRLGKRPFLWVYRRRRGQRGTAETGKSYASGPRSRACKKR